MECNAINVLGIEEKLKESVIVEWRYGMNWINGVVERFYNVSFGNWMLLIGIIIVLAVMDVLALKGPEFVRMMNRKMGIFFWYIFPFIGVFSILFLFVVSTYINTLEEKEDIASKIQEKYLNAEVIKYNENDSDDGVFVSGGKFYRFITNDDKIYIYELSQLLDNEFVIIE